MGNIFALCGPSGAGKTTFLNKLVSNPPELLRFLARATVREKRPKEIDGIDYDFYGFNSFYTKFTQVILSTWSNTLTLYTVLNRQK